MPQKIKKITNNLIDFIFDNWLKITVFILIVAYLFLAGHTFGINERIWNFLILDWESIINAKSNIISLFLAIGSTISAIFAVIIAVRANRISKIALEVERPVLEFSCETYDKTKESQKLIIKNIGKSEATNIELYLLTDKEPKFIVLPVTNLSYGVSGIEIFIKPQNYTTPFKVKYKNIITGKSYKQDGEIRKESNKVHQLSESQT